jgi:uncharacterized protein YebE (UPF0316 family)
LALRLEPRLPYERAPALPGEKGIPFVGGRSVFSELASGAGIGALPALIFVAETCVVTICTLRTIFLARGRKYLAPLLGFFEVSLWLLAIGEVMKNLTDPRCSLAFAGGFTLGNFLGILIEQKLALGSVVVQAITNKNATELVERLRTANFGVTCVDGQGASGPVRIVVTVLPRKQLDHVVAILKEFDPKVFYSVDGLQSAAEGVAPTARRRPWALLPSAFRFPLLPRLGRG